MSHPDILIFTCPVVHFPLYTQSAAPPSPDSSPSHYFPKFSSSPSRFLPSVPLHLPCTAPPILTPWWTSTRRIAKSPLALITTLFIVLPKSLLASPQPIVPLANSSPKSLLASRLPFSSSTVYLARSNSPTNCRNSPSPYRVHPHPYSCLIRSGPLKKPALSPADCPRRPASHPPLRPSAESQISTRNSTHRTAEFTSPPHHPAPFTVLLGRFRDFITPLPLPFRWFTRPWSDFVIPRPEFRSRSPLGC